MKKTGPKLVKRNNFVQHTLYEVIRIELDKIKLKGYAFQIEMKFTSWKLGYNIIEVPIVFTDRRQGASKMSGGIFREAVWGVIKMKILSFFKKYKR